MIGQLEHAINVMLDQQHRHIGRDTLDDRTDALAFRRSETGERFVEQQDARRGRQRHAHVQQPLSAIGQRTGLGALDTGQTEIADDGVGFAIDRFDRQRRRERIEAAGMPPLHRKSNILADTQGRKQIGDLERPADAGGSNGFRRMPGNRFAEQRHRAIVGRIHAGQ